MNGKYTEHVLTDGADETIRIGEDLTIRVLEIDAESGQVVLEIGGADLEVTLIPEELAYLH